LVVDGRLLYFMGFVKLAVASGVRLPEEGPHVNKKVQLDATVCRHLFTAKSLYMFRVS